MGDLFLVRERFPATVADGYGPGLALGRRRPLNHQWGEGLGEFREEQAVGRQVGLKMEGEHLRTGQGVLRAAIVAGRWRLGPEGLPEPAGVGLIFGVPAGQVEGIGLILGALGLVRGGRNGFDDVLVAAGADLVSPEDGFDRRAAGQAGDDGDLDLRHGERVSPETFDGGHSQPFRSARRLSSAVHLQHLLGDFRGRLFVRRRVGQPGAAAAGGFLQTCPGDL